jgi:hypothetical protein
VAWYRSAEVATAARSSGRGPHFGSSVGPVALARVPNPLPEPLRHTSERHRHGLRSVRYCPHCAGLHHPVGLQQHGDSVLLAMLTHASWNTFYSAALIGIFPAPTVKGSYLNPLIGGLALALVLIALTREQLGYRGETDAPSAPRVR